MIINFKLFENNKDIISKFYIDIRNSSDDEKMKALNILEEISKLSFNGTDSKKEFIYKKYWCWEIKQNWYSIYIGGIHTPNWGMPEIGEKMLTCKEFIETGPENVDMFFTSNKYNL